jgi:lipopolysaccharide/colanic/teichoic acid biosynthesis glycosyltransferase
MKRTFDVLFALVALIALLPFGVLIAAWIWSNDGLPIFFRQERVGLNGRLFRVWKFRSMYKGAERKGQLTVSGQDPRITKSGAFIRKYKIDELPQLLNVLVGDMSLVGPRPEVARYVKLYTPKQCRVLSVRPGLTDHASLEFINENDLLAEAADPERFYIEEILPKKLDLQLGYVTSRSFGGDLKIMWNTVVRIMR